MLAACIAIALAAGVPAATYASGAARRKMDLIESGRAPRGARLQFSAAELNSWIAEETKIHAPLGARNPRLVLGAEAATGYADIDFLRLRQAATGEAPGWFLRNLFSGERPVKVTVHFESRAGRARVDVERVEVSGVALEGRALDLAIDAFVRPAFPNAVVSEWFPMQDGVERFTVSPAGVAVFLRR
jgi:hypothetical protein